MNKSETIVQYYGSIESKRAIKLIYKDSSLKMAVICESMKGKLPSVEVWENTKKNPFKPGQINVIGAYRGFANQISEKEFEDVFNVVSQEIITYSPN